jgi:hypothetical protein
MTDKGGLSVYVVWNPLTALKLGRHWCLSQTWLSGRTRPSVGLRAVGCFRAQAGMSTLLTSANLFVTRQTIRCPSRSSRQGTPLARSVTAY